MPIPRHGACFASAISKSWPREEASAAVEKLHHLAESKRQVTLLYASRNEEHNNATVLKELLEGMPKPPSSVGRAVAGGARIRKAKQQ